VTAYRTGDVQMSKVQHPVPTARQRTLTVLNRRTCSGRSSRRPSLRSVERDLRPRTRIASASRPRPCDGTRRRLAGPAARPTSRPQSSCYRCKPCIRTTGCPSLPPAPHYFINTIIRTTSVGVTEAVSVTCLRCRESRPELETVNK